MIPPGSIVEGTTRKHAGRYRILKATPRSYRVEIIGRPSRALSPRGRWIAREVLESQYRVLVTPKERNAYA